MAEAVIVRKLANALFADAQLSDTAESMIATATGLTNGPDVVRPVQAVLAAYASKYGGLWVGGAAELTAEHLRFAPNAMNRILHLDGSNLVLDIPLASIESVQRRFGFISGIIDITADGMSFSIRCMGAAGFAATIRRVAGLSDS